MYNYLIKLASDLLNSVDDYEDLSNEDYEAQEERIRRLVSPADRERFQRALRRHAPEYQAELQHKREMERIDQLGVWLKHRNSPEGQAEFRNSLNETYSLLRDSRISSTKKALHQAQAAGDEAAVTQLQRYLDRLTDFSLSHYDALEKEPKENPEAEIEWEF